METGLERRLRRSINIMDIQKCRLAQQYQGAHRYVDKQESDAGKEGHKELIIMLIERQK